MNNQLGKGKKHTKEIKMQIMLFLFCNPDFHTIWMDASQAGSPQKQVQELLFE